METEIDTYISKLKNTIETLSKENDTLAIELAELRQSYIGCHAENEALKQENAELKKNFEPYVRIVDSYGIANKILNQKIKQLESELATLKTPKSQPIDNKALFDNLYDLAEYIVNGKLCDSLIQSKIEDRFATWFIKNFSRTDTTANGLYQYKKDKCYYFLKGIVELFIRKQKAKGIR